MWGKMTVLVHMNEIVEKPEVHNNVTIDLSR